MPRPIFSETLAPPVLPSKPRALTQSEIDGLWAIFAKINSNWELFHTRDEKHLVPDALNLHSTWLEFVRLRAQPLHYPEYMRQLPSYVGEYENALTVVDALRRQNPDSDPLERLLRYEGHPNGAKSVPVNSRFRHARKYVVEEFMTVMIIAGGFKEFGGRNYNGFIGGSRFNEVTQIVSATPGNGPGEAEA